LKSGAARVAKLLKRRKQVDRRSGDRNKQRQNKQPREKFAGSLAKILSAGQKETEMAGVSERRQIINTQKTL
jgi:hypothetical protein